MGKGVACVHHILCTRSSTLFPESAHRPRRGRWGWRHRHRIRRANNRTGAFRFGDTRAMALTGALCVLVHAVAGASPTRAFVGWWPDCSAPSTPRRRWPTISAVFASTGCIQGAEDDDEASKTAVWSCAAV